MAKVEQYPKWVYGENGATRIVNDEKAHAELQGTWHESPADVPKTEAQANAEAEAEAAKQPELPKEGGPRNAMAELPPNHVEHDRLVAEAEAVGLKVDGRWSDERLRREILEHASA